MKRAPEVIDCWFDSGSMPFAQLHYPFESKELFDQDLKQADYICEGVDQTRGWFYSLHAISTLLFDRPCYKNCICLELVLDAKGEKMSKSRGNVVKPMDVVKLHGADALRWYCYTSAPPGSVRRFDTKMVADITRSVMLTLWNVYSFFVMYANIDNYVPDPAKTVKDVPELDLWILSELNQLVTDVDGYLSSLISSVDSVSSDLGQQASTTVIPLATIQSLLAQITAVRLTLTSTKTTIDNANAAFVTAEGTLALAKAGSTANEIDAAQAGVEQAQAGVTSAQANLENGEIIAPISGVVTEQNAKIGQVASPGVSLVSIIGNGGFEVDMGVAETDIGKIVLGDTASMTLDAFPNETFTGVVFYVAPAETNTNGVITYLVKVSFAKPDARLKSGLTANVDIQTKYKDDALILPQYAILQNDQGTFVETLVKNKVEQSPVVLGIEDQEGNVEVVSGVTKGEQVLNIGLKAQ